ncbi:hypothetical protein CI109_102856 [Kwoniella shandongensis]|uniref:Uncharacterized protein n=1 Tax=Kwoniella shandongensis TaxID=1734106 RepID=A0A5M6C7T9_9TREE|nr:uncharacterized protein CI109_000046 [Kwoniella shandongensis]KAA5531208.1 hypothetical protein CI109_000046 [Kwoniella shandongensis]
MSSPTASSSTSPYFLPFDPASPMLVTKGVLTTGTLGAITGASIGVVQSKNPFALSINMTINLSIASLTFFGLREYIISPFLLSIEATPSHTRRLRDLQRLSSKQLGKLPATGVTEDESAPSLMEVRTDRLLDSALAGGLTGGVLSSAFRGRATFGKAFITSSLIGSILQLSANQLRVFRLEYLAKQSQSQPISSQAPASATGLIPETAAGIYDPSLITNFNEHSLKSNTPTPTKENPQTPSLPEKMMKGLSKFLPVRKLTDDEYLEQLQKKRDDVDKRLREIEDEEKRMYEWAKTQ